MKNLLHRLTGGKSEIKSGTQNLWQNEPFQDLKFKMETSRNLFLKEGISIFLLYLKLRVRNTKNEEDNP